VFLDGKLSIGDEVLVIGYTHCEVRRKMKDKTLKV